VGALLWLLIPMSAGIAAGVWAWCSGRRHAGPPDHDTWEDLDRYQRLRTALAHSENRKALSSGSSR
jgi:hypothetical protein